MRQRIILEWTGAVAFFVVGCLLFLSVFLSPEKPIRYAQIPQETKDYFNKLIGQFEFDIRFVDFFEKDDWLNEHDPGQASLAKFAH